MMHVDEPRGEVDASLLTRITSIGPIDESGRLLKGGVGVDLGRCGSKELMKRWGCE
jgi:hypothetical protein